MSNNNNQPPPWSEAPPWAKYRAQDEGGEWFAYESKPYASNIDIKWRFDSESKFLLMSWCDSNPNWRNTLQKRPENE